MRVMICPHCGKQIEYSVENTFRPFCSKRCKLIDLGGWADESYRVPASKAEDAQEENESGADDGSGPDEH